MATPRSDPHHAGGAGVRSGAHRPSRPAWHAIVPVLVVVLAVVVVGYAGVLVKHSLSSSTSTSSAPLPDDDDNGAAPTPTGTASGTATHKATSTPTGTPTKTATSSPSSTATAPATTVLRSHPVRVYNATNRVGLAAGATTKLVGAGWKAISGGNERRFAPPTTVYYGKASLLATAKAVATSLGGYRVAHTSTYGSDAISVVLGTNYAA